MFWESKNVLVTGGASFIGSHLVDELVRLDANVTARARSKPVGVVSRALDITRAKKLLGWEPEVSLNEGLRRTIEWYIKTHTRRGFVNERLLMEHS